MIVYKQHRLRVVGSTGNVGSVPVCSFYFPLEWGQEGAGG